ncbi:MAG: hypothetical protein PHC68_16170, partial [Syntrophorhabdaceae bacterium]|nr:hypothetical protein [Syntrophorhabdaceae bacterium]
MTKKMKRDPSRTRLGEILLKERFIRQEQLDIAIEIQEADGGHLGEILVNRGMVREEDVALALSQQFNIPFISSKAGTLRPEDGQSLEMLISKQVAVRNTILPISRDKNTLTCAMFDPHDFMLVDELRKITGCDISPVVATRSDILKAIEEFYGIIDLAKGGGPRLYGIDRLRQTSPESDDDSLSLDSIIARAKAAPV